MKNQILILIIGIILLYSCNQNPYNAYVSKDNPAKKELMEMFPLLENQNSSPENKYTLMGKILKNLVPEEDPGIINLFITDYINKNPEDPYNAYYLSILALSYINNDNPEFARSFLHKVVTNYKDLTVNGISTHFSALETLIKITPESREKVNYYKLLIKEHPAKVDSLGLWYYYLGETYEEIEMWQEAIDSYSMYLNYPDAVIPGNRDAREQVLSKVNFFYSNKRWVVRDLNRLVNNIKWAISVKDSGTLDRYRAEDFFIVNWKSSKADIEDAVVISSSQLVSMNLRVSYNLDRLSNENEAFLEVSGARWSSNIWAVYPSWYFYFRRINYPMDPEIHGGWEWAGIYLGERL